MNYKNLHRNWTTSAILTVLLLCSVGMTKSYAYDFSAVCETGQTLYYNITNAEYHYVELTYPGNSGMLSSWQGYDTPTGDIIVPRYVYDANGNQYFVTSIGSFAFYDCNGLTGNLTIPNYVTSIGELAFRGCIGLTSLTISNSVTSISNRAFEACSGFEQIVVQSQNAVYDSRDNCNAIIKTSTNKLISACKNTVIPNTVTSIGDYAFCLCTVLTSVTIPNSVTSIGNSAFASCTGLTSITIPNSVTSIGKRVFSNCYSLTSISLPNSVTSIGLCTFENCSGLSSIDIPNSVTTIGDFAFERCSGLVSINIPNSVTSIGLCAFQRCNGLTSMTIPNSVTTIGRHAFRTCTNMTSVTIGNSVTIIDSLAFYECSRLSSINMLTTPPPTLRYLAFYGTSNTLKIYVPYESVDVYKTATNWSDYESRIYPMVYKTISGYETSNGNWAFIASPLAANTAPTAIDHMIASNYDLYRFNQAGENGEWQNYKAHTDDFTLANGQGYLYANAEDVNLIFKGTFNENSSKTINLIYEAGEPFAGWNLVGNPFPMAATVTGSSYYVMNAEGTQIDPIAVSSGGTINPCTGIMVQATVLGQPITFTRESRQVPNNNGILQIAVAQNNTRSTSTSSSAILDKAIVSFNEGDQLGKFVFNKDNAKLYIPQGNEDYAIAYAEKLGEMPLNFEAKESGSYTISVNPESVEINYLHLIDNMTGTDIDLLVTPSYTFESKTNDYASRFRLVFSAGGDTNDENEEPFAFVSNGNIIVTGDYANATLQIVDMLGHVVVSTDAAHNVPINGIASGVYVLRLINGNDVKTQKIVIR